MIRSGAVYSCDARGCGHIVGSVGDDDRPVNLVGLIVPGVDTGGTGFMGTVEVPTGNGVDFETRLWYAHRAACIRKAIESVIDG